MHHNEGVSAGPALEAHQEEHHPDAGLHTEENKNLPCHSGHPVLLQMFFTTAAPCFQRGALCLLLLMRRVRRRGHQHLFNPKDPLLPTCQSGPLHFTANGRCSSAVYTRMANGAANEEALLRQFLLPFAHPEDATQHAPGRKISSLRGGEAGICLSNAPPFARA